MYTKKSQRRTGVPTREIPISINMSMLSTRSYLTSLLSFNVDRITVFFVLLRSFMFTEVLKQEHESLRQGFGPQLWQTSTSRFGVYVSLCRFAHAPVYWSNTFFTSPILRCTFPPAFSIVPRSRKSGSPVALPAFSFTSPFASLNPPLILSFVLDFIKTKSHAMNWAVVILRLKAI